MIDVFHEVLVTPRRAFPRLPDLRVIERPGWLQILTPSLKTGGLNEVIHSVLADEEADRVIDETIAMYRDRGLRFRWNAGPASAPADLAARLLCRGLEEGCGRGMARGCDLAGESEFTVELVGLDRLDDYTHVMATGWSADRGPLVALHRQMLAEGDQPMFVAYAAGAPVGAASYHAFASSAFLRGAVVLPAYRGRGVYRALVAARLAHARSLGIELATTHARESSSAPILERLGFETVFRFAMYFG